MSRKKQIKRIFSVFLATVLLISAIPLSLAVQNLLAEETPPKIIREVTELREESVKHFLCEDGSYIAATYSAPVHYKENGEWKEIDNSLSLDRTVLSVSGKPTYTTKAGGLSVSIPQSFSDGQKITTRNKGYEIGFGVNANQNDVSVKASASVVDVGTLSSNIEAVKLDTVKSINNVSTASTLDSSDTEAYNAEIMTVDNQSSAVTYEKIMSDTDFEYIVTSNSIKENIVVYEPKSEYTYSFDMDFDGLTPIINPDNSISLTEPNNPDETIFFIEAPYMYDSNGEESIGIEMSLVANGDEYVMTLVASAEWINDESRAFPVVIDPTIYFLGSGINDVFIVDGLFAGVPRFKDKVRVGRDLINVTRTFLKPELPANIPLGSEITSATLKFYKDSYYQAPSGDDIRILAYDCCNVAAWELDEISWNNQPFNNSDNGYQSTNGSVYLSGTPASSTTLIYSFNIKEAVQRWVNGGVNNGILLASSDESTKTQVDLFSSRYSKSGYLPNIFIEYEVPKTGITSWTTGEEADSRTVSVTAALDWTVTSNQPWLTVTNVYSSAFRMAVSDNTGLQERTGEITVTMGDTVISTIEVVQYGTEPTLLIDKQSWNVYGQSDTTEVTVTSNDNWNIIIDDDWVTASISEGEDNAVVTLEVAENTGTKRETTVTFANESSGIEKTFSITQLDIASSYFCEFDSNGNITSKGSSQYNHNLATWAMELSYAAYNPIANELIPGIPGNFREPPFDNDEWTAEADLISKGFEATSYNYDGLLSVAAHTIGHRTIEINDIEANNNNLIGEIENDGKITLGSVSAVGLHAGTSSGYDSGMAANDFQTSVSSLTSDSEATEAEVNNCRQLVVVSVRGSVTLLDWAMDLLTQFHVCLGDFDVGAQMVIDSLYGYDNCTKCDGSDEKCPCKGYLVNNNITDPIFLVTGHSMGAAIANLVAAELNEIEGAGDVYGYTFATPYVKAYPLDAVITQPDNIFNILNTNDVVTYVPTSWLIPGVNIWSRYGIDIPLNMPFNDEVETDILGVEPHSMAVYMNWMKNNKNITYEEISEKSSESTVRGLLPKFVKVKCPVRVSVKDSDGHRIAYKTQEDVLYTQAVETSSGIVSWIDDDGAKTFFIPASVETESVEIEAYDYGTMDIAVGTAGTTDESEIKVFNDVPLYPGKEFVMEVSEDVLPEDSRLFVTENGEIVGEITDTNPFFKGVTVNPTEAVYGETVTFTLVTDNTVTAMMLHNTNADDHVNLVPGEGTFNVEASGENELTWTVTNNSEVMNLGENVYDLSVQSDGVWYFYENVIAVDVTLE